MKRSIVLERIVRMATRWVAPLLAILFLASCGGGGDSSISPTPAPESGTVVWTINDAAGDFTNYVVTIDQIKLTRDDGAVVQALAAPVTVDLSQLVDTSQLFASASLPTGTYTSMTVTLNYNNANIAAEDSQGQIVDLAPVTQSGAAAGTLDVALKFTTTTALVVAQGTPLLASLDFDLTASNTVDFTASPPTVTVEPVLYAAANPADLPYSRASGTLTAVNTSASTYTIDIVPLFYTGTKDFGTLTVTTDAQTNFLINGNAATGASGLEAMNALAAGTATLAYGSYNGADGQFKANEVYAGSSVPGADADVVHGSIVARNNNTLTVFGKTYIKSTATTLYHTRVSVSLGAGTMVFKAGNLSAQLGTDDISVGQRVTILGSLTDTTPTSLAMDAGLSATGYVQLAPTLIAGTLISVDASQVVMNLDEINYHPVTWFNFAGTGSTLALDADPTNYEINPGSADLSGLTAGAPARIEGFVQTFGQAPPDFNAENVGNYQSTGAMLMVTWRPDGTNAPFSTQSSSQLVVDLQNTSIGPIAVLRRSGAPVDLTTLPASPQIVPPASSTGLFGIRYAGTITIYVSFSAFMDALQSHLGDGVNMTALSAQGGYDDQTNTFTLTRLSVNLK